ncbi:hypothetical protein XBJ1_0983 [Xenorhabdus bovienii SS-2004]|uniref:Uncharacterized protein n=2 Tax=Xenorhabdus bovienii TaxID=40576 RepID=D3UX79_XENBS|nr:hypothetical protein XBJ1_0983 [Xenorhabdus bovienii SS-2004]
MVNDEATIWTGNINNISFSFLNDNEKKQRITGELNRIFLHKKGDFYLSIIDGDGINHIINEQYVETKFLVRSSRYEFVELCREILKLNNSDVFEYANIIRDIAATAKIIKETLPIRTSFTYTYFKNELRVREKYDVLIDQYLENEYGHQWISGLDSNTGKRHIFQKSKIDTMLNSEGHKKHKFDEWLSVIFGIENNGNK